MANVRLKAEPREARGKKTRFLRRQGLLPANIYGQGGGSLAIQIPAQELTDLLRHGGRNQVVDVLVDGERAPQTAIIRQVQRDPVSRDLLHADFMRVSMTETMTATVPLVFTGESPAARHLGGVLMHGINAVTVSALPGDIPQHIEVDLSPLEELDATLHVADLQAPPAVHILTDPATVIAKVAAPRLQVEEEEAAAEAAAEAAEPEVIEGPAEQQEEA